MIERIKDFYDFMNERERIRLRREQGVPFPWTKDPILSRYRFTNVRRDLDKTTAFLNEKFYSNFEMKKSSPWLSVFNAGIFRYFGTIAFAQHHGWASARWCPEYTKMKANELRSSGVQIWTGAYMITMRGQTGNKIDYTVDNFITPLFAAAERIADVAMKTKRWQAQVEETRKLPGFGGSGFMAKEVTLDTILSPLWRELPVDFDEWTASGPGSRSGTFLVCLTEPEAEEMFKSGKVLRNSEDVSLKIMKEVYAQRDKYWKHDLKLHLHDIQFQMCEWAKYERIKFTGWGKRTYSPSNS